MTEDDIKDLSKLTEALNGFATSEGKEKAGEDHPRENKKKRAKQPIEGREYSDDTGKKIYTQRCSNATTSAEAILISGVPHFLVLNKIDSTISIQNFINLGSVIYLPPESTSYMNKPYSFSSEVQVNEYIYKTRKENLDSLYKKVKAICKKYIEADDFHISMCAADIIFTYSQARLGLTHYLFFVGDNTSGKSNNLTLIHTLAYRNFMSSDMTAANVYQYLGNQEEGQGTLCIDEADQIDSNIDLMRIFKNGYTTGFPVARVDTSNGRKQQRFFTFGFKAFSAERLPDSLTAKGFNQRVIVLSCTYGIPQYDISEVLNPAGEGEYEARLAELYDMRNTLLVYGLLHHHDNIPNIPVNLSGREKQLFKPVIRVFQNTESQKELLQVVSKYVGQRREQNANSLHSFLYRLVTDLIKTQGTNELESTLIWNTLTDLLPGDAVPNRKLSYESSEFGPLSQKGVVEILIQVFGAKHSVNRRDKRKLIFDMSKLERLGQVYNVSVEVKVGTGVTDETDVTDIGLDRYVQEHDQATNKGTKERDSSRDHNDDNTNGISSRDAITNKSSDSMVPYTNNPSQVSHPSQQIMPTPTVEHERDQTEPLAAQPISKTIYRIHPHSDIFGCNNCKLKGDKWEIQEHRCKVSRK